MLLILVSVAWLAVLVFGLSMCRLAARSDELHDLAVQRRFADQAALQSEDAEREAADSELPRYRAAG